MHHTTPPPDDVKELLEEICPKCGPGLRDGQIGLERHSGFVPCASTHPNWPPRRMKGRIGRFMLVAVFGAFEEIVVSTDFVSAIVHWADFEHCAEIEIDCWRE